jgi:hypothetical protein
LVCHARSGKLGFLFTFFTMIGTIRKHVGWLWWLIAGLTIISFVFFMGAGPVRSGGGGSGGEFGRLYGRQITAQDFARAKAEVYLYYWAHNGQWPDKNPDYTADDLTRDIYIRLMLDQKARQLDIHVGQDALVAAANDFLRSLGHDGQPVDVVKFTEQVLAPEGLSLADLQNFLRDELAIQQMVQTLGLSGALVTPQEASRLYDHENQEVSAQAVFFAASNYLAQVAVTPAAVAQFYTNMMAVYREPDRVQVDYVAYELTNYQAAAEQTLGVSNLDAQVESVFAQHGMEAVPDAKTPAEAKAKIREYFLQHEELAEAKKAANDFANELFAIQPVQPGNLAVLAKQKGLAAHRTAPFSEERGPVEFDAPASFTKAAFQLSADQPFSEIVTGPHAVYLLALASQLPSAIPSLEEIRSRVAEDFRDQSAVALARNAGTNFYVKVSVQMAAGKSFAQAAVAGGRPPELLPPFSLSTRELPELGDHATVRELQEAAFTTAPGHIGHFQPTDDGGFVLFVQQVLPVDQTEKTADLPKFLAQVRRVRASEAFNRWLQVEANRELRNTPFFQKMQAAGAAK